MKIRSILILCIILISFQNCSNQFQSSLSESKRSDLSSNPNSIESRIPLVDVPVATTRVPNLQVPLQGSNQRNQPTGQVSGSIPNSADTTNSTASRVENYIQTSSSGINQREPAAAQTPYELGALMGMNLDKVLGRAQIVVASEDRNKLGFFFFTVNYNNSLYILDPDAKGWRLWDQNLSGYLTSARSLQSTEGYGLILINFLDMTAFGGGTLSVGYGVGENIVSAVNECLRRNRLQQIETLAVQTFSGTVYLPRIDYSSDLTYSMQFYIRPAHSDYLTTGKYFIFAVSPDGGKFFLNGTTWVNSDGKDIDSLYFSMTDSLVNFKTVQKVIGKDLGLFQGWKLFAGYGKNYTDMINRKLVSSGTLIK
jgi:hypothetical protein